MNASAEMLKNDLTRISREVKGKKRERNAENSAKIQPNNWLTKSLFHCLILLAFWLGNLDFDLG
jgi:hypothetical protein